jgi:signal transduction histidine kinase/DNA-binding response OmpR family regulator
MSDAAPDVLARLERRVQRERASRLAAEQKAEEGLRELYLGRREVELLRAVATEANGSTSIDGTLRLCIGLVCGHLDWRLGHARLRTDAGGPLMATDIWHGLDDERFMSFRAATDALGEFPAPCLPERVVAKKSAHWVADMSRTPELGRAAAARDAGLRAALAIPAFVGDEVAAVLEIFSTEVALEDRRIVDLAASVGVQVGRAIERHRARIALELASRSKTEFLANMSHEIRTPMTSVLGYADLLMDPDLSPSERLNFIQVIRRNGEHLLTIINDILDLSKIEAGKMTVETVTCSPIQILVDVASLMRVRAIEKDLDFGVEYVGDVPETIQSDPTRLRQILMNLVGNAVKFTEEGAVRIVVECDASAPERPRMRFSVVDQGIGLTRDQIDKLFQPFTQADSSTTRRFGGSGLGLTICKRLADMLGGAIRVDSEPGKGSSFILEIDTGSLEGVAMVENLREAGLGPTGHTAIPVAPGTEVHGKILLAEDGADNQILISTHLRKAGAKVVVAENGRIAVDMALSALEADEPFDVIFMDMQMPELDGYGATAKLRSRGYTRPIIALTAHAMTGDRERCIAAGCDDYTTKPVNRAALIAMARQYVESVRSGAFARKSHRPPEIVARAAAVAKSAVSSRVSVSVRPATAVDIYSDMADDDEMTELIERFVARLDERTSALTVAIDRGDTDVAKRIAHQLKGAAGGYGFPSITDAAAEVERAVGDGASIREQRARAEVLRDVCSRARPGRPPQKGG